MSERIIFAGGGTGGHVFPLVAIVQEVQKLAAANNLKVSLRFMGDGEFMRQAAQEVQLPFTQVSGPKWRRYSGAMLANLLDLLKLPFGIAKAFFAMWWVMPDALLIKGGYASYLPALAARFLLVPIFVHESDAIPGVVNQRVGKSAKRVFISYESSQQFFKPGTTQLTGNPIRQSVLHGGERTVAAAAFQLDPARPIILVTGASQGSKVINDTVLIGLIEMLKTFQIIHLCGQVNYEEVKGIIDKEISKAAETYSKDIASGYRLFPFLEADKLAMAYAAADIIVGRAGGMIFEMAALGKPAIVVPLKDSASDHQLANAQEFAKYGGIVVTEDNFSTHILLQQLNIAYQNREALGQQIRGFAKPDAAQQVAKGLLEEII